MSVSRIKRRFEEFINLVMQQGGDLDLEFFTFSSFTIFIREPGIDKSTKQSIFQVDIHSLTTLFTWLWFGVVLLDLTWYVC